jgi:SAM-dependent methyltransferase
LLSHFSEYASFVKKSSGKFDEPILEIGSNDGLLLKLLAKEGFTNLTGIDPSPQTRNIDITNTKIINEFFDDSSAANLPKSSFEVIIANNCFSHIPKLTGVLSLCRDLLKPEGILIVEVQSTLDLIEGMVFDYIYHEHYFYHTVTSFAEVARLSGLDVFEVQHVATKGGSYRILLGHKGAHKEDGSVNYWKYREQISGVHTTRPWKAMKEYLGDLKRSLLELLSKTSNGVVGYGASATGTVFLRYMDLEGKIDYIVDDNPKRQGLFAPGTGIPVRSPVNVKESELCLILAWRHADHIVPKVQGFQIPYIVPLPALSIHV